MSGKHPGSDAAASLDSFANDLRALMTAWDTAKSRARGQFPNASEAEIDVIARKAMDCALELAS